MRWSNSLISFMAAATLLCYLALPWQKTGSQSQGPVTTQSPTATPSISATASPTPQSQASPQKTDRKAPPEFLVIIDPSHGGDDKGATYPNKPAEKDLTLAFARELRNELDERGIAAHLLREADISLPLEKRVEIANGSHNAIYVAIHAGFIGQGVRIYSPTVPGFSPGVGPFVPWSLAQSGALPRSRILAKAVVGELQKKRLQVIGLNASLRPLNNIVTPAIAVELIPKNGDSRSPENLKLQNAVASAVASGIAASRGQTGAHP
jgi:N-acetylmuramoyl-L-alanine amidase